jgi:hypothetical protein
LNEGILLLPEQFLNLPRVISQQLRAVLAQFSYPAAAIPGVYFSFESQETVDRDFGGGLFSARR